MNDPNRDIKDSAGGTGHTYNKKAKILKYIPAATLLAYAYLYLLGYLYLFFYFTHWGLNVHEMGFSIVDYATIAIYPNLRLMMESSLAILLALLTPQIVMLIDKYRTKRLTLRNSLTWLILVPILLLIIAIIYKKHFILTYLAMLTYLVALIIGYGIVAYRKYRKAWLRIFILCSVFAYFGLMLILSAYSGIINASIYRKYSYNFLSFPSELNELIIFSNEPLPGLDIYQTGTNKYEGLFLLAFKQDIYYLVPNIRRHELFYTRSKELQKEVDKRLKEVDELNKNIGLDNGKKYLSQLDGFTKKIDSLIERAKTLPADSTERAKLLGEAEAKLKTSKEISRKIDEITDNAKQDSVTVKTKLAEASELTKRDKELSEIQSLVTRGTYAINKDKLSHVVYLYGKDEKTDSKK